MNEIFYGPNIEVTEGVQVDSMCVIFDYELIFPGPTGKSD